MSGSTIASAALTFTRHFDWHLDLSVDPTFAQSLLPLRHPYHHLYLRPLTSKATTHQVPGAPTHLSSPNTPSSTLRHHPSRCATLAHPTSASDPPRFLVAHLPSSQQRRREAGAQQLASHGSARVSMHGVPGLEGGDDSRRWLL